jgi:dGTPase
MTMFTLPTGSERDNLLLAPYATATRLSRGRQYAEPAHPFRPLFQRDRERIVHCSAFRRLMLKTQVLAAATTDHHRTRLTHTLEVAQVSRTIVRQLGLQEDLTEAIALSHDLGHPPFGHAGEAALDECMADNGGFDHNLHSLRIVDILESPYPGRPGLNLSWEVREAMAHHSRRRDHPTARDLFTAGEPTLEARVVDAADSLAYDAHDLDDALGHGLITLGDLEAVEFWRIGAEQVRRQSPGLEPKRFRKTVVRALIEWQVTDLLDHSQNLIRTRGVAALADVRRTPNLIGNSDAVLRAKAELEGFLRERVYRHPRIRAMAERGQGMVRALFSAYRAAPGEMSPRFGQRATAEPAEQVICDYVAGMTDRFARQEYGRLFPHDQAV